MKAGTLIELPDGRRGVVVYHGLDGYGVRLGKESLSEDELQFILTGTGGLSRITGGHKETADAGLIPTAMLRDPYPGAQAECVGTEYDVVTEA